MSATPTMMAPRSRSSHERHRNELYRLSRASRTVASNWLTLIGLL